MYIYMYVCVLPACLGYNIRNIVSFLSLCFSPIEFGQHFCLHFVSIATQFRDFHCVSHCQACFVAIWVFPSLHSFIKFVFNCYAGMPY